MTDNLDLTRFCAKPESDPNRDYLWAPQAIGLLRAASNGRIVIAQEHSKTAEDHPDGAAGFKTSTFFDRLLPVLAKAATASFISADRARPWVATQLSSDECKCLVCKGAGKSVMTQCEECGGAGTVDLYNDFSDYTCDCKTCRGTGSTVDENKESDSACEACSGSGYSLNGKVEILPWPLFSISIRNWLLIADIQGLELGAIDGGKILAFRQVTEGRVTLLGAVVRETS